MKARSMHTLGASALLALSLVAPMPAHAALFGDDEARSAILQLREQRAKDQEAANARITALTAQIDRLSRSLLEMNAQLELLRADMAKQRGQDELLARDVAEIQKRQKDIVQGVEERVRKLEPQDVTLDGKTFRVDPEEKREFEEALARLRQADFSTGLSALNAFVKKYPDTGYKESALYWQGNAHYGLRAYKESISVFKSLLALAPQHLRASEALLSIANCHSELKEPKQARKALEDLVRLYPDSEAAQVARERMAAVPAAPAPKPRG